VQRKPKCAACYYRISKDGSGRQAGITRQRADCTAHVQRDRIKVHGEFIDNDRSASKFAKKKREEYLRMLTAIDAGEVDTVICWHTDRLYREPRELEDLIDRKVLIITMFGTFDTTQDHEVTALRLQAAVAAQSSMDTSRRTLRARKSERERGDPPMSLAFGWRDRWTPDPKESAIVVELYDRILAGDSLTGIARDLTARKVPQKRGGAEWHPNTVRQVIRSPRHGGLLQHDGKLKRGKWDPIIEPAMWKQAQAALNRRGDRHRYPRTQTTLLTGLVHCGRCGHLLTRNGRSERSYLRCGTRVGQHGCGNQIPYDVVEPLVVEWAMEWSDREDLSRERSKLNGKDKVSRAARELRDAEQALRELQDQVELGYSSHGREGLSLRVAAPLMNRQEAEAERLRGHLASVSTNHGVIGRYLRKRGDLRKAWQHDPAMTTDVKRSVLAEALALRGERIVVAERAKGQEQADRVAIVTAPS
jgi:DNA invertase Pin-like site-specific DNA recombinase